MKNILLIGKLNDLVKEINQYLSKDFHMQLSSENLEMIRGMLKVLEPDLVIICLVGLYDGHDRIFQLFQNEYPSVPVLTLGTEEEWKHYTRYYEGNQFENLIRPISNPKIYNAVCQKLNITTEIEQETNVEHEISEKKRVLVVDDNGPTLRTIKAMLDAEYDVTVVNSGMNAMKAIGKRRPNLILLDYEMPVCDGRQTLEMIRADEEISDIPVIFLTGVNDREHIEMVLALRPAGYLLKPPVKERLLGEIKKAIGA